eukprot:Nitzschia sp. Nitz4//scaffold74_size92883//47486//53507//NITZ4_004826-RA/size92883-augustus-gene-0.13-mRNA-1//-1//CDS//3329557604//8343//frame0
MASSVPIDGPSAHSHNNLSTLQHLEAASLDALATLHRSPLKTRGSRSFRAHQVESLGRVESPKLSKVSDKPSETRVSDPMGPRNDRKSSTESSVAHSDHFSMINANLPKVDSVGDAQQDHINPQQCDPTVKSNDVPLSIESEAPDSANTVNNDHHDASNTDSTSRNKKALDPQSDALDTDSSKRLRSSQRNRVQKCQAVRRSSRQKRPSKKVVEDYSDYAVAMDRNARDVQSLSNPVSLAGHKERLQTAPKTRNTAAQDLESNDNVLEVDRQTGRKSKRKSRTKDTSPEFQSPSANPVSGVDDPDKIQEGADINDKEAVHDTSLETLKIVLRGPISNPTAKACDPDKSLTKKRGKRKAPETGKGKEAQTTMIQSHNNTDPSAEDCDPDEGKTRKRRKRIKLPTADKELGAQTTATQHHNSSDPSVEDYDPDEGKTKKRTNGRKLSIAEKENGAQTMMTQNHNNSEPSAEDCDPAGGKPKKRTNRRKLPAGNNHESGKERARSPSSTSRLTQNGSLQLTTNIPTRRTTRKRIPVDRFAPNADLEEDSFLREEHLVAKPISGSKDSVKIPQSLDGGTADTMSGQLEVKNAKKIFPKKKGKRGGADKVKSTQKEETTISSEPNAEKQPSKANEDQDRGDESHRNKEETTIIPLKASIHGKPPPAHREPFVWRQDPNPTYIEEIAHSYHNPPLPSAETDGILPGGLKPIPPPPEVPEAPSTGLCDWTYDELNRIYLGVFKAAESIKDGIHPVDKEFLLLLLERNDITVITEGLLDWNVLNPDIWNLDNILNEGSYEFSHKLRRFDKVIDASGVESVVECDGFYSMRLVDYVKYLNQRQQSNQEGASVSNTFEWKDYNGVEKSVNVQVSALYLVDVDITKYLPGVADDFRKAFRLETILPGGKDCMMNQVPRDARPTMGPNMYVTPPSTFTHFHQDGHGSVDSGHLVISGYNEVVMLRRMTERHKRHALWILTGKTSPADKATQKYFDGLYSEPHEDGLGPKPSWPTPSLIQECRDMGYCPSVFILKPGQHLHINKGRLHAFRKMTVSQLPESDCHSALRANLVREKEITTEQLCVSIAWDWMFRGKTPRGINREIVVALEASTLNRKKGKLSLGIPEMSLLRMAQTFSTPLAQGSGILGNFAKADNCSSERERSAICRGILPGLRHVILGHIATMDVATCKRDSLERGERISFAPRPNSWENPATFGIDPYGNEDFACKLCSKELSNIYFHCDGCEKLLSKDFNICADCYQEKKFMVNVKMHPHNPKKHATINHTGGMRYDRNSRCPCKNGPCCHDCGYCLGCSCRCHTWFTLNYRFFKKDAEEALLRKVEDMAQKWKEGNDEDEYLDDPDGNTKVEVSQDETHSMDVDATTQNPAGDKQQEVEPSNSRIKQEGESNDQPAGASATTSLEADAVDYVSTEKSKPPATIEITDNGFAKTVPVHTNPGPKDVIFGRGEPTRTHTGNLMLREFVSQRLQEYMQTTKTRKSAIIGLVIKEVEEAGARYLVPLDASSRHSIFTGGCREATRAEVRSKVSHAFRDGEKRALLKRQKDESTGESQEKVTSSKRGAKPDGKGNSAGTKPKESSSDLLSFATILTSLRDKSPSNVPENENEESENVQQEPGVGNGAQSMKSPGSITKNLEMHCGALDIVFGRGAPLRRHPGNIRFREIVESFTAQYKAASKHEKTDIIKQVIQQVSENGSRFLIMEDGSVKSATPDEIRMKVSHRFRDFSKASSTSSVNSRTSPPSTTTTPPVHEKVSEEHTLELVHNIPEPEVPMESETPDNIVQV